jgi:hypothetical protein
MDGFLTSPLRAIVPQRGTEDDSKYARAHDDESEPERETKKAS